MMKKFALVAVLAGISTLAIADNNNVYVQADVGYARVKAGGYSGGDNTVSYGIAVGTAMENGARLAVDYKHLANNEFNNKSIQLKTRVQSVGASAIYDFKNDTALTPYLGIRASVNRLGIEQNGAEHHAVHSTDLGIGAVAGVQYQVAPNLALDGAIEYNYLGKYEGAKLSQYGAKAGVRYDF